MRKNNLQSLQESRGTEAKQNVAHFGFYPFVKDSGERIWTFDLWVMGSSGTPDCPTLLYGIKIELFIIFLMLKSNFKSMLNKKQRFLKLDI